MVPVGEISRVGKCLGPEVEGAHGSGERQKQYRISVWSHERCVRMGNGGGWATLIHLIPLNFSLKVAKMTFYVGCCFFIV